MTAAASVTNKLDEMGRPAWIVVMIIGFIVFWPLGLAVLAYLLWSGRMGCHARGSDRFERKMQRMHEKMDRMRARMTGKDWWEGSPSSGNAAFDEYKAETLKRLEEEQDAFHDFLEQLRMSKDRAEFDQFMSQRRGKDTASPDDRPRERPEA
ncbi:uncharacterized protein DUF2852 [Breoghania corrubedonensis]|uniref:Uncharacterized protein DUF2852 n=1 Tax=Breoghania corrubedonensis TaxID=665038 RepID=A0A2T5V184_9HYPH|nr:DUF2852 domain-containing protein [Breoghania corrubedonensis]PTW57527.1 uncharacterized protein DUF2852 [Breoghania corrubedonensis]